MLPWLITSLLASLYLVFFGELPHPIWTVVAANFVGIVTLLFVQTLERQSRLKSGVLKGPLRTWIVSAFVFFGLLALLVPDLRDAGRVLRLGIPLIFAAGLVTPWVFGPIQDRIVARIQRKARGFTATTPRAKS